MTKIKGCLFHDLSLNFASFSKHGLHYCINEMYDGASVNGRKKILHRFSKNSRKSFFKYFFSNVFPFSKNSRKKILPSHLHHRRNAIFSSENF